MKEKQSNLIKNCEEQIKCLAKSPSFIMSLGAKELFHSNFLAFLLETDEESLKSVQNNLKHLFGLKSKEKVYVWREKSNLDLVLVQIDIEDEDSWKECAPKVSIIENKLKSIPTKEQLVEYDKKIKKGMSFDLYEPVCWDNTEIIELVKLCKNKEAEKDPSTLVLMKKKLNDSRRQKIQIKKEVEIKKFIISMQQFKEMDNWIPIEWNEIKNKIQSGLNNIQGENKNELLITLVDDYSKTLNNIIEISKKTALFCLEYKENPCLDYEYFNEQITNSQFKRHRIHDLVGKIAVNNLKLLCQEDLKLDSIKTPKGYIFNSYDFYSNQLPGFGFEWKIIEKSENKNRWFSIGVQIQGNHYRHFIEAYPETKNSNLKEFAIKHVQAWFYPEEVTDRNFPEFFGKQNTANDLLKFNENKFLYSRTDNKKLSFTQLTELVTNSMSYAAKIIENNVKAINQLIDEGYVK